MEKKNKKRLLRSPHTPYSILHTRAFALVEALVAAAILSVVLAGAVGALLISMRTAAGNGARLEAAFLADEGIEVMRVLRDTSWDTHIEAQTSGTPFFLEWNGSAWTITDINTFIDGQFERSITLSNVYRDSSEQITEDGGSLDSDTRKVEVSVSWYADGATSTRTLTAYITNLFDN